MMPQQTTPPTDSDFTLLEELVGRHATPPLEFGGDTLPYETWRQNPDRASLNNLDEGDYDKLTDEDRYTIACNRLISNGLTPGSGFVPILHQFNHSELAWQLEIILRSMRAFRDITHICGTALSIPDFASDFMPTKDVDNCAEESTFVHLQASMSLVEIANTSNLVDILRQLGQLNLLVQVSNDLKIIPFTINRIARRTNNG